MIRSHSDEIESLTQLTHLVANESVELFQVAFNQKNRTEELENALLNLQIRSNDAETARESLADEINITSSRLAGIRMVFAVKFNIF